MAFRGSEPTLADLDLFITGLDVGSLSRAAAVHRISQPAASGRLRSLERRLGVQSDKLPSGHLILYPASSLHRVEPITRGSRVASFFWIQSMVRDSEARQILFDLDSAVQSVAAAQGHDNRAVIELTGVYHNLLRRWAGD
jgi:PKHD-type hydroxylase